MSQIKLVSAFRYAQGNIKKGESLYIDLEEKVNKYTSEGWQVIGAGPERSVEIKKGFIVEMLRKIPVVQIVINWLLPIEREYAISLIIKND